MPRCKVKGCTEDPIDFVTIHIPNTSTENYDAVNPVKVPICIGHLRVLSTSGPITDVSVREAFDL